MRIPTKAGGEKIFRDLCQDEDFQRPTINQTIFPHTGIGGYWSSLTAAKNSGEAWYVYFNEGGIIYSDKNEGLFVRLVRSSQ